ncbi:MAG: 50S ribosomal protein L1 [Thermoplasmata archaeon]|nr:MAG: 50S ribosomal protein L1 [Thermoplasmata archaeon]
MAEKKTIKAVSEALESSKQRNFKESVDLAVNLKDIDLSIPKNRIDDEILLPKGRGKPVKIAVFGTGELALKAKSSADLVISPEELEDLAEDKKKAKKLANEHSFFIAEAPLMPVIGKKLGVVLGPRGKMPKPIPPGADPTPVINNLRNTVRVRSKDRRTFHASIGTKDMTAEDLAENIDVVIKRVIGKLERGRMNIASVYIKTTMGESVRLM